MRKNRMMAMMMAGAMAASLAACGSSSTPEATTAAAAETTAAAADTTAAAEETTAAGTETTAAAADDDVKNASNVQPEIPEGATVLKLGMTTNEQDSFMIAAASMRSSFTRTETSVVSVICLSPCRWAPSIWVSLLLDRS